KLATKVYDWADLLIIMYSSVRVSEYIESTCRAGSGRSLYYRVSITDCPASLTETILLIKFCRPEHLLYKGLGEMPLICNPMLPILAIFISRKAFKDYETIEDLLNIQLLKGEIIHLQWKESVLDLPFFKSMSAKGMPEKIEIATTFNKRFRLLGFRARYLRPPIIHDFKAEGLY
ncbi:hypothetical protein B0T21DRAFT_288972, partial [Apiosordaria backusii]